MAQFLCLHRQENDSHPAEFKSSEEKHHKSLEYIMMSLRVLLSVTGSFAVKRDASTSSGPSSRPGGGAVVMEHLSFPLHSTSTSGAYHTHKSH